MTSINASPTKEFFIDIITRDISLLDAVKDLVDNCVDGARALRPKGDYKGLSVEIEVSKDHFLIVDNCGGIPVRVAAEYAFRFGRAKGAPSVEGSIGQFGVGMKRALFKMGEVFEVRSTASDSHFLLTVDVEQWKGLKDADGRDLWTFEFDEAVEGEKNPPENCGTTLQVTSLHPSISADFGSEVFKNALVSGLQEAHARSMDSGLDIKVNAFALRHRIAELLSGEGLKPIRMEWTFPQDAKSGISAPVKLTLYAGVSDSNYDEAGWYIVCNGRQIVRADKTSLTGWAGVVDGITTPKAHQQFSRFRGYAIFESDDASALPWNTQKSGIDLDSRVYQWALQEMIRALRQVIDFLNALDAERDTDSTFLRTLLSKAKSVSLSAVEKSNTFQVAENKAHVEPAEPTVRIQFSRSVSDVEFAKQFFKVSSAGKAGESAFDYFMVRESD